MKMEKENECISINLLLCNDVLRAVKKRQHDYKIEHGKDLNKRQSIEFLILGK